LPSLHTMARKGLWPTPTARDWRSGKSNLHGTNARPLNEVVLLWPTPTVKGNYNRAGLSQRSGDGLAVAVNKAAPTTGGALNPTWVEWLMGFPLEWTACVSSATPASPRKRRSRGAP